MSRDVWGHGRWPSSSRCLSPGLPMQAALSLPESGCPGSRDSQGSAWERRLCAGHQGSFPLRARGWVLSEADVGRGWG